nr:hypothetical protein [Tanacetum cinerariifolium]
TVADEPASHVRDVSEGEACPTESGFIANQDRVTIAKTSTLPHDSAPRVTSPAADEGKEIARVLTSMDAVTVLAGEIDVPTGSGFIPTVGPPATVISTSSEVGPTASPIVTRRKGKEVMEQVKKQKSSKESPEIETTTKEFTEEKIKKMMQLVPVEDVYVQALQVKHPIIDWKVH